MLTWQRRPWSRGTCQDARRQATRLATCVSRASRRVAVSTLLGLPPLASVSGAAAWRGLILCSSGALASRRWRPRVVQRQSCRPLAWSVTGIAGLPQLRRRNPCRLRPFEARRVALSGRGGRPTPSLRSTRPSVARRGAPCLLFVASTRVFAQTIFQVLDAAELSGCWGTPLFSLCLDSYRSPLLASWTLWLSSSWGNRSHSL